MILVWIWRRVCVEVNLYLCGLSHPCNSYCVRYDASMLLVVIYISTEIISNRSFRENPEDISVQMMCNPCLRLVLVWR